MKNYYLVLLLMLLYAYLNGQQYEIQLIHLGGNQLAVQMRETTGGTNTPTSSDGFQNITFAVSWSQSCGGGAIDLNVISPATAGHADYSISRNTTQWSVGTDFVRVFTSPSSGVFFPENWVTNTFTTIATIEVTPMATGVCDFCLATTDLIDDNMIPINSESSIAVAYMNNPNAPPGINEYPPTVTNAKATAVSLPVELTSFKAKENNRKVDLTWTSAAEIDFDGYHVERSKDGKNFEEITWVNGIGSPTEAMSYSYQDKDITGGTTYYYRLAMLDFDASVEYSAIEAVHVHSKFSVQAFPKPTRELLNLRVQSEANNMAKTQLVDICGRIVYESVLEIEKGNNEFTIQDSSIPNGIYMLIIRGDGWQHAEEVVFID